MKVYIFLVTLIAYQFSFASICEKSDLMQDGIFTALNRLHIKKEKCEDVTSDDLIKIKELEFYNSGDDISGSTFFFSNK